MAHGDKRSYQVYKFLTPEPNKVIEISVAYCSGGESGFGQTNPRAYFAHMTPVELDTSTPGFTVRRFRMFSGTKVRLEETKRYNKKRLLALVEQVRADCEQRTPNIMNAVNHVLASEGLTLVAGEPVMQLT